MWSIFRVTENVFSHNNECMIYPILVCTTWYDSSVVTLSNDFFVCLEFCENKIWIRCMKNERVSAMRKIANSLNKKNKLLTPRWQKLCNKPHSRDWDDDLETFCILEIKFITRNFLWIEIGFCEVMITRKVAAFGGLF